MVQPAKKLVFENGEVFEGKGFGANVSRVCEVVFNTSMVGYQEIFSDPTYNAQMVCMTYPLIGNYGMAAEDYESSTPHIGGFIVREYNDSLANFRAAKTLQEEMEETGIPGIEGVDTRRITRMLRKEGTMRAYLCDASIPTQQALQTIKETPVAREQVAAVSSRKRWYARAAGVRYNVAAIDCGIKNSTIACLAKRHCNVTVLPYDTKAEEVLALAPDGVLLSNGPGDPADVPAVIELVRQLQGKVPVMGIGLGHQLIALANGCKVEKLKFGHRGSNHPVKVLKSDQVEIVCQNHGYVVERESVEGTCLSLTHVNLLDNSVEGLENEQDMIFSVQYNPESKLSRPDSPNMFDKFVDNMEYYRVSGRKNKV